MRMKKIYLVGSVLILFIKGNTQTWAENIAPILYSKCVSCHRPSGIAPFSLITYSDAFSWRTSISTAVASGNMPPWPPNDDYVHFTGARTLTASEKTSIINWVNNNAPSGNLANAPAPPPPVTNGLGSFDVEMRIPNYTSTAAGSDIYQCFVLPLRLATDKFVSAIEVIPGNQSIVHHVLVFQDTTFNHAAQILDNASPGPGYTSFGGIGVPSPILVDAWVPGTTVKKLPSIFGKKIFANSDLVIQVHYPAGSVGKVDSTKLRVYYNTNATARDVRIEPILNHLAPTLVNGPLVIPANTIKTFEERFMIPFIFKASILAIAPHMHLIGSSIKSYANKPNGDTIRLIDIPHWDFHWQGQYYYQKPVIIEGGSVMRAFATYNNTSSNPHNPNSPPQTVSLGEATTDEMMLVYFAFTQYQAGDENIIIDSSQITTPVGNPSIAVKELNIFPNPVQSYLQFHHPDPHVVSRVAVWDMNGRKVYEADITHLTYINIPARRWTNGVYRVYVQAKQTIYSGKILVQH